MNETERQNTHGCTKLPDCSVGHENEEGATCTVHSELSCTRQDGEVPATVTQLLPKCCSASLTTCQGAGSGSSSGYNCSTNIINSSTWLVASSHPLPGAAQEQHPLAWVTHLSA